MNNPLIVITINYVIGILLSKLFTWPIIISLIIILLFALYKKNILIVISILFILIGCSNCQLQSLPPPKSDISYYPRTKPITLLGQIEDEPDEVKDLSFFTLKIIEVDKRKATGKVSVICSAADLKYGDTIELNGRLEEIEDLSNPGLRSYGEYLKEEGIYCQIKASRGPPKIINRNGGSWLVRLSISLKNRLIEIPKKTMPEPYATLLSSIIFGTRASKTPAEIKDIYKRAGVAHLLVASGMHLGILIGVCLFLVRPLCLPLWPAVLIISLVNLIYSLMTGFGPSILRAAIMAEIMLVGLLFEKEKEVYTSLSLAAFIILLCNPLHLFNVGFQLSFGATLSLVYVAPVINERLKIYLSRSLSSILSVAIAPVLVSLPITLYHFSQASLIGVVTNMLLLPWIGMVVVLGFAGTVIGVFFLPLAEMVNGANLILLWVADRIVYFLASLPFAQMILAPPSIPLVIAYYAGLAGMVEVLRRQRFPKINFFRITVLVLAVLSVLLWHGLLSVSSFKDLTITVLDVGQGDAFFIETGAGKRILIDGGDKKMGQRIIIPYLQKRGIQEIDMVILTHPHDDHVGGLPDVMEKIKVKEVLDSGFSYNSEVYNRFLELIQKNKIKYHLARAGDKIDFSEKLKGLILHPSMPFLEGTNSDANNASIVMRLTYGKFSMLFTGDSEGEGEKRILELFPESVLTSNMLKAGHHGSRTSSSNEFLDAVNPEIAIISCGKRNKFKHPHKSTLQHYKERNIKILRTDRDGAVVIKSDGKGYEIKDSR